MTVEIEEASDTEFLTEEQIVRLRSWKRTSA